MRRIITSLLFISIVLSLTSVLLLPSTVRAEGETNNEQSDLGKISTRLQVPIPLLTPKTGDITITSRTLAEYIIRIYNFLLMAAVVLATVMLVWGGFMWMTAGGGAERVGKAQEYIWNAIAGLIILFGAYLILSIVNPELTTLKPLKLQQIKPIATGFFCDQRIDNLQKILRDQKVTSPKLQLVPVQTRGGDALEASEVQNGVLLALDPQQVSQETNCDTAYIVKQTSRDASRVEKTNFDKSACFGRLCAPAADGKPQVCEKVGSMGANTRCVRGYISGTIASAGGRGIDFIRVWSLNQSGRDTPTLVVNTSPSDTQYAISQGVIGLSERAPEKGELYYLSIEVSGGYDDVFYIGKGQNNTTRRIEFSSDDNKCYITTDARAGRNTKTEEACSILLWTGEELLQGKTIDIDITNENIFGPNLGENVWVT